LIHVLHPWVAFAILPLFAFANAGVVLRGVSMGELLQGVPLAIALGLFVGKQLGVFGFAWIAIKTKCCPLPAQVNWGQLYGVAILTGVGFTMSLFIGSLAYPDISTARVPTVSESSPVRCCPASSALWWCESLRLLRVETKPITTTSDPPGSLR
jgi:Na+/H+ antiporter NhaA